MEIPEKLMKLKYYIIFSSLISLLFLSLVLLAPRFLTIVSYFWPLFVSTALFLFTVVFFAKVSPLSTSSGEIDDDQSLLSCAEKAGEGLLDYVAGQPPPNVCLETIDDDDDDDDTDDDTDDEDEEIDHTPVEDTKSIEKSDHIKLDSVAQGSESEVKSN